MEKALRDLEYWGTIASLQDEAYEYPKWVKGGRFSMVNV